MTILTFTAVLGLASFAAGLIGALTGLGGGVVIVPLLVIAFGVDIRYAIGASLVSVIATSSGAAAAYVKEGCSNIKLGMFLEIATTVGALSGATLAAHVPANGLAIVFGLVLLYSAYLTGRGADDTKGVLAANRLAVALQLDSNYPTPDGPRAYHMQHVPTGFGLMYLAWRAIRPPRDRLGSREGPGHGSGDASPVQGLDHDEQLHDRRDRRGQRRHLSSPRPHRSGTRDAGVLGVLLGSMVGARVLNAASTTWLRAICTCVIVALALEMLYNGLTGKL